MIGSLILAPYTMFTKMNCVYFGPLILDLYMYYIRHSIMCRYGKIKAKTVTFPNIFYKKNFKFQGNSRKPCIQLLNLFIFIAGTSSSQSFQPTANQPPPLPNEIILFLCVFLKLLQHNYIFKFSIKHSFSHTSTEHTHIHIHNRHKHDTHTDHIFTDEKKNTYLLYFAID